MTTLDHQTVICAVCGAQNFRIVVNSTNAFGSPDLDLRPPSMQRETMPFWVQSCQVCGYAAPDITEAEPGVAEIMHSEEWRQLTGQPDVSRRREIDKRAEEFGELGKYWKQIQSGPKEKTLANLFLRRSLIAERLGDVRAAAYAALHAAWAEDDGGAQSRSTAQVNRRRAAALFSRAIDEGKFANEQAQTVNLILIDILRRAGNWDAALERCRAVKTSVSADAPAAVLRFQEQLIVARDAARHTVAEATTAASASSAGGTGP